MEKELNSTYEVSYEEELISIVVPVYNVEKYLEKCVNSIIQQSYKNIEIILVDDGSQDSSGKICDLLESNYRNIKVIHKNNGGLSDARNMGIKKAKGNYISFVDSDDQISENLIKILYNTLKKTNSDISICDPCHVFNSKKIIYTTDNTIKIFKKNEAISELFYQKSFLFSAWGKLYKKELFNGIAFPKGKIFEDVATIPLLFEEANLISYCPARLYAYMHREGSITTSNFSKRDLDIIDICDSYLKRYEGTELYSSIICYKVNCCLRVILSNNSNEYNLLKEDIYIRKHCKKALFDKKSRLKTRIGILLYLTSPSICREVHSRINRWKK